MMMLALVVVEITRVVLSPAFANSVSYSRAVRSTDRLVSRLYQSLKTRIAAQ